MNCSWFDSLKYHQSHLSMSMLWKMILVAIWSLCNKAGIVLLTFQDVFNEYRQNFNPRQRTSLFELSSVLIYYQQFQLCSVFCPEHSHKGMPNFKCSVTSHALFIAEPYPWLNSLNIPLFLYSPVAQDSFFHSSFTNILFGVCFFIWLLLRFADFFKIFLLINCNMVHLTAFFSCSSGHQLYSMTYENFPMISCLENYMSKEFSVCRVSKGVAERVICVQCTSYITLVVAHVHFYITRVKR